MAGRYALWAKNAIEQGRWSEALAGLERARDFADVSSDISYLLAMARLHENMPRGAVLDALEYSIRLNLWNMYSLEEARLLKAEQLIALRAYPQALVELSMVSKSIMEAELTLKALSASQPSEFRSYVKHTLDRYPRESGPVKIFLGFLKNREAKGLDPEKEDLELLELIIRRLPALLLHDAELAWITAPYMWDFDEAKRLVMAYRAIHKPLQASIPAALLLGIIDEVTAMEELFGSVENDDKDQGDKSIDIALLGEVWDLLRYEEARELFRRNLSVYTGVITEDSDMDGIPETSVEYRGGIIVLSCYDTVQEGIRDLTVFFEAGDPKRAIVLLPPESSGRKEAVLLWERYPCVLEAELDGARYIPRPLEFYFSPVRFVDLWDSGVLFPQRNAMNPPLTRRSLVTGVLKIERPSQEFRGGIEVVELAQGIPVRAREYVGDLMVSETEFIRGRPQLQRVDLDLDGRIDTIRRFNRNYRQVELEELWDYDRDIEYSVTVNDWE